MVFSLELVLLILTMKFKPLMLSRFPFLRPQFSACLLLQHCQILCLHTQMHLVLLRTSLLLPLELFYSSWFLWSNPLTPLIHVFWLWQGPWLPKLNQSTIFLKTSHLANLICPRSLEPWLLRKVSWNSCFWYQLIVFKLLTMTSHIESFTVLIIWWSHGTYYSLYSNLNRLLGKRFLIIRHMYSPLWFAKCD